MSSLLDVLPHIRNPAFIDEEGESQTCGQCWLHSEFELGLQSKILPQNEIIINVKIQYFLALNHVAGFISICVTYFQGHHWMMGT